MSKPETRTLNVALYYTYGDFTSPEICEATDWHESDEDYLRISDTISVTFSLIPHAETVKAQISVLKEKKSKIQADAQARVTSIEGQIQNLLALPSLGDS